MSCSLYLSEYITGTLISLFHSKFNEWKNSQLGGGASTGGEGRAGQRCVEGILNHYLITLHPWDGGLPSVSLVGSRPFSCYPIEGLEGTAADSTGLKHRWSRFQGAMAWRDWQELSDSNISIPPTCQAIFFFFFFFNLDVVDITSEILLLALQVCLSAKTLPPGSSFFLSNVNWAEYHKKLSQIPAIKHTEVDPPWNWSRTQRLPFARYRKSQEATTPTLTRHKIIFKKKNFGVLTKQINILL